MFAVRSRVVVRSGQLMLCAALALASTHCVVDFAGIERANEANGNTGSDGIRLGGIQNGRDTIVALSRTTRTESRPARVTASTEKLPGNATKN